MENNQYPNNQTPMDGQHVQPNESVEPHYVRIEEAQAAAVNNPTENANPMAEPVGAPYKIRCSTKHGCIKHRRLIHRCLQVM